MVLTHKKSFSIEPSRKVDMKKEGNIKIDPVFKGMINLFYSIFKCHNTISKVAVLVTENGK